MYGTWVGCSAKGHGFIARTYDMTPEKHFLFLYTSYRQVNRKGKERKRTDKKVQ